MNELFRKFAHKTSELTGTSWAFSFAVLIILIWAVTGPLFDFSPTWQLVINTTTTIITFLMIFLVQNTQNRDAKAIHLKLDELIKALGKARNALIDAEDLSDDELEEYRKAFMKMAEKRKLGKDEKNLHKESNATKYSPSSDR